MNTHGWGTSILRARALLILIATLLGRGAALGEGDPAPLVQKRIAAVQAAMRGRDLSAVEGLISGFASEPSGSVRAWTIRALARLDAERGLPVIEAGLKDRDPEARIAAAEVLGQQGGKRAHAALAAALGGEPSPGVRATIAFWLGSSKDPAAAAALDSALISDPDPNVRVQTAQSLKRMGLRAAKKSLKKGLKDADERVRKIAR